MHCIVQPNSGSSFTEVTVPSPPNFTRFQWWDWVITVSPDDVNELYAGGIAFYKSTNGGTDWSFAMTGGGVTMHVDFHHAIFHPVTDDLYVGNDGGVFRSPDGAATWENLSDGLHITQYYRLGVSKSDSNLVLCGSQDNGTHQLNDGQWSRVVGGDGMECLVNPRRYEQSVCKHTKWFNQKVCEWWTEFFNFAKYLNHRRNWCLGYAICNASGRSEYTICRV